MTTRLTGTDIPVVPDESARPNRGIQPAISGRPRLDQPHHASAGPPAIWLGQRVADPDQRVLRRPDLQADRRPGRVHDRGGPAPGRRSPAEQPHAGGQPGDQPQHGRARVRRAARPGLRRRAAAQRHGRRGAGEARDKARTRDEAREILRESIARCLELGLSPGEISSLAYHHSLQVERLDVKVSFVECNAERRTTSRASCPSSSTSRWRRSCSRVRAGRPCGRRPRAHDLLPPERGAEARARQRPRRLPPRGRAIVIAPHVTTLVKLAQLPSRAASASSTRPRPGRVDPAVVRPGEPRRASTSSRPATASR